MINFDDDTPEAIETKSNDTDIHNRQFTYEARE